MTTKNIVFILLGLVVLAGGAFLLQSQRSSPTENPAPTQPTATTNNTTPTTPATNTATSTVRGPESVIGTSADGVAIQAYHFGTGEREILFIGGIHGGYSWSTPLLAYTLIDHLKANPALIPEDITVTVIPVLNPDGLKATVGTTSRFTASAVPASEATRIAGRFNGNTVDLNRNFDCEWSAEGTWQNRAVSGGSAPFSEPEAAALRDYVNENRPTAVVAWYSAAGGVYASNCGGATAAETTALVNTYATAAGYTAYNEFDYYELNGDMMNWFAKSGIPAASVLLTTHNDTEWNKNRAGIEAVLKAYAE